MVENAARTRVDGTTLRVLSTIYGSFVKLEGQGADDNLVVRLSFEEATSKKRSRGAEGSSGGSADPATTTIAIRQPRSFKSKPPKIAPLPAIVEKHRAALALALASFAQRSGGPSAAPPALLGGSGDGGSGDGGSGSGDGGSGDGGSGSGGGGSSVSTANGGSAVVATDAAVGSAASTDPSWEPGEPVTARSFCAYVRHPSTAAEWGEYREQLVHVATTPPCGGQRVPVPDVALPPPIVTALSAKGIDSLYAHQAEALSAAEAHLMVATPTSSGKSLVYSVPAVAAVLRDPHARTIMLFPTKALAQDQLGSLSAFADVACPMLHAATLDGDTSRPDRLQIATRCHVVLTNPDLLHVTVLPKHAEWRELLANLQLIVVDEAHTYHGVFGSHVALVLRRLRRLAALYGASPRLICCSATLANPREHMCTLTGLDAADVRIIQCDAAPSGHRTIGLWNPPKLAPSALTAWHEKLPPGHAKRRASSLQEASTLLVMLITHGLRTIAFVRTRAVAERLYEATRDRLGDATRAGLAIYRAGYLKEKRREIERALFGGKLTAVVATTALELGVDVGTLDCTLHLGYPGSTASLAQQAGRAGRGGRDALALLVAADNPLEQHLMAAPRAMLERPLERTVLNPHNPFILRPHLAAAAHERPLRILPRAQPTPAAGGEAAAASIDVKAEAAVEAVAARAGDVCSPCEEPEPLLGRWAEWSRAAKVAVAAHELRVIDDELHLLQGKVPAAVSLRDIDSKRVRLVVTPRGQGGSSRARVAEASSPGGLSGGLASSASSLLDRPAEVELETMEEGVAQLRVYEGAVYLHAGASYTVHELDLSARVAWLHREDVNYYTEPRDHTRVAILRRLGERDVYGCAAFHGPMRVSKHVYGYRKCARVGGRLLELVNAERAYPPMEYQTRGLWLDLPSALRDVLQARGVAYARGGLHALEHVLIGLAPLCATCEPTDLGCQCTRREGDEHAERLLLFERRRGGVGVADALLLELPRLLEAAAARLASCDCSDGCLSCVHMAGCGEYNEGLDKQAAKRILRWLLEGEWEDELEEEKGLQGQAGSGSGGGGEVVGVELSRSATQN